MQQSSPSYRESYQAATVADAAHILGVSESTIRRLVRTGKLEAERVERPQGHAWLVKVPVAATDPSGTSQHLGATTPANQPGSPGLTAWTASVLEPLVLELRLSRETIAGQAERLGYVTAERDAARAELAAARASPSPVDAPTAPLSVELTTEPPGSRWHVWGAGALMVLTIVALAVLLAWPR
jgi:excisionase family DNA binding protein